MSTEFNKHFNKNVSKMDLFVKSLSVCRSLPQNNKESYTVTGNISITHSVMCVYCSTGVDIMSIPHEDESFNKTRAIWTIEFYSHFFSATK